MIFLVGCALVHRYLCSIWHDIKASVGQGTSPTTYSYLDPFFLAKFLLPVLHQKQIIYHLISQVKELLIKLAWSTMLGVSARNCSQTTEEQANTISINKLSKIGILGFWLYSLKTRGKKVIRLKKTLNHEYLNDCDA